MSTPDASPPAGWYPDPQDDRAERWWNGLAWTASTREPEPVIVIQPAAEQAYSQPAVEQTYAAQAYAQPAADQAGYLPPAYAASPGVVAPYYGAGQVAQPYGYAQTYSYAQPYGAPVRPAPVVRGMGDAIKSVFRQYAGFEGRASRTEFWYWYLFNALLTIGVITLLLLSVLLPPLIWLGGLAYVALILWGLSVFLPTLALEVRRLRDAALPWPLIFLSFVPFGGIVLIVLWCQPSKS